MDLWEKDNHSSFEKSYRTAGVDISLGWLFYVINLKVLFTFIFTSEYLDNWSFSIIKLAEIIVF